MNRPVGKAEPLTAKDAMALQAMSLEDKIQLSTWGKMYEWYQACAIAGLGVCISFSGGKDSTVLAHLVGTLLSLANLPKEMHLVFSDTGLEYPEIREFAKWFATVWLPEKFPNLSIHYHVVKPKMIFRDVVIRFGYPLLSKDLAHNIRQARYSTETTKRLWLEGIKSDGTKAAQNSIIPQKWRYLTEPSCDIDVGAYCCDVMKKNPIHSFQRRNNMVSMVGVMAEESNERKRQWLKNGCNAFDAKEPKSNPLSFWTNQDILRYIVENEIPICSVYGDIVSSDGENDYDTTLIDCPLKCTGCQRTGCIFCGFGAHLEEPPNRFERLKLTHPQIYRYAMGGGAYDIIDNRWKPTAKGLGMDHALDVIGVAH